MKSRLRIISFIAFLLAPYTAMASSEGLGGGLMLAFCSLVLGAVFLITNLISLLGISTKTAKWYKMAEFTLGFNIILCAIIITLLAAAEKHSLEDYFEYVCIGSGIVSALLAIIYVLLLKRRQR